MPSSISPTREYARRRTVGGLRAFARVALIRLLGMVWLLGSTLVDAEPARVQILLSESGGVYAELLTGLEQQLKRHAPGQVSLNVHVISNDAEQLTALLASRPALVIPVGIQATAKLLRSATALPVLSLLISEASYNTLSPTAADTPQLRSAIFLDQPIARQLNLLQLLLPHARVIASLNSPASHAKQTELAALCQQRGLQLSTHSVAPGSNPIKVLTPLLESADVLMALPDPAIFNRSSLQAILLTTYRGEVPVLGFSHAYVRAGALSAVHSTAQQIGQDAADWIAELAQSGAWQLGAPRYPRHYSVTVNQQVAQSLSIHVADEDTLLTQLRKQDVQKP